MNKEQEIFNQRKRARNNSTLGIQTAKEPKPSKEERFDTILTNARQLKSKLSGRIEIKKKNLMKDRFKENKLLVKEEKQNAREREDLLR